MAVLPGGLTSENSIKPNKTRADALGPSDVFQCYGAVLWCFFVQKSRELKSEEKIVLLAAPFKGVGANLPQASAIPHLRNHREPKHQCLYLQALVNTE